jgi:hypothetical protein
MLSVKFRLILEIDQPETRIVLWRPCLLTDQGPVIDVSCHVSDHFGQAASQEKIQM